MSSSSSGKPAIVGPRRQTYKYQQLPRAQQLGEVCATSQEEKPRYYSMPQRQRWILVTRYVCWFLAVVDVAIRWSNGLSPFKERKLFHKPLDGFCTACCMQRRTPDRRYECISKFQCYVRALPTWHGCDPSFRRGVPSSFSYRVSWRGSSLSQSRFVCDSLPFQ
jgi:hypothetical protein